MFQFLHVLFIRASVLLLPLLAAKICREGLVRTAFLANIPIASMVSFIIRARRDIVLRIRTLMHGRIMDVVCLGTSRGTRDWRQRRQTARGVCTHEASTGAFPSCVVPSGGRRDGGRGRVCMPTLSVVGTDLVWLGAGVRL